MEVTGKVDNGVVEVELEEAGLGAELIVLQHPPQRADRLALDTRHDRGMDQRGAAWDAALAKPGPLAVRARPANRGPAAGLPLRRLP
ncbi:hypothetical protein ALMP_50040 [Streptomyces sp. A012304]|nr:hypothetical protein ALMP_50040 [Streptomyces sp. A012304]